jgi:cytochrome P450
MSRAALPAGPRFEFSPRMWSFFSDPRSFYAWLRGRYGELVTLQADGAQFVLALTAEGARQVLTKDPGGYEAFHKEAFAGLAGAGSLWVLDGARHRRERQLLLPQFTAHRVRNHGQIIAGATRRHIDGWRVGQHMRAYDAMLDISLDVILHVMFGSARGGLIDEGRRALQKLLRRAHPLLAFYPGFQRWWFPPWVRYRRAQREFSAFVALCLAQRRATAHEPQDVLDLLLAARYDDGTRLSDEDIRDELVTIILVGHETTAVALSWALYEVARHPAVLARLRDELDALGPDPDPDLIVKQSYLGAVCDETLRLHTILTEIGRISRGPCELLGRQLPAGTAVGIGIGAIHQDPALYPDPDEFRPERFLERRYTAFEFLPFGGGHRRCLGAHLSDYEMRIVLASTVTRWEFELAGSDRDIRHNIGTGPKHGVRMRLTGRRSVAPASSSGARRDAAPVSS